MKENKSALVLFSGGQDSTTCLYWAKEKFEHVTAICIEYGQRHNNEIEIARKLANDANVEFVLLDASLIGKLSFSALTSNIEMDQNVEEGKYPNTFVPGRNLLFLCFAATYAFSNNIRHIITGVSQADYSGYPDCRQNFVLAANMAVNMAMDKEFEVHTPLMWLDKAAVWQLADELGVLDIVMKETLTCYNGIIAEGCGECPSCKLRNQGLERYLKSTK